ncbi:glycoside hydrolase family 3 N-terminal domain-containing protein [Paenibacillus prosopidis]|uniref:Beta-glucosidase n=1 Tax=Paenibacillus prosopidis TaxID=630520 RepID=A0A368W473_9BACL|nr:glycoside hydrolase family 3 N-terminal domain-containing protein [Paenibacillus prosopidis]RCW50229.1 beta-glucosidase [Paenibacillus prosopidis]
MIGIWHSIVTLGQQKSKYIFVIEENDGYSLTVSAEPMPLPIEITELSVEDKRLKAAGCSMFMPGETISIDLTFGESVFAGTLKLPYAGEITLNGASGRGPSLSEDLIEEVAPYRKSNVQGRSDDDIKGEVEQLLERMSLVDKIGQMSQCLASAFSFGGDVDSEPPEKLVADGKVGSILGAFDIRRVFELQKIAVEQSPLRIPLLFNADVIHGHQTIFPVPLAWSCSWDMEEIKRACAIAAKEAAASGITYNHAPMVDITRDARWGRVVEGAGEDPYLGSEIAKAQVEGFQGGSLFDPETIIACLKHFIAYGAAEAGRDYNTVDISEGTLRNVYLPPFRAGLEAGAGSVMNAFNIYQGVPVAGNSYLLRNLLRDELGFEGMLISDYGAIDEIAIHGAAKDGKEAAKLALDATMDIEMVTRQFYDHLPSLIEEGAVQEAQLDAAVRRILTYKFKIGLMDDPFRYVRPEKEIEFHFSAEHLEASRELARKSIVLLKNDGVLPIKQDRKIAVIGPFASSKDLLGPWQFSRYGNETVTLANGLRDKGVELLLAEGCKVTEEIAGGFKKAIEQAKQADVVILALGENSDMSGEAASRMDIGLPEVQLRLAEMVVGLGKPTVLVLTGSRPLVLDWFDKHVDAIVETWFLGSQAGHAIADVLLGDYNPSGKLTMSFPYKVGQAPVYYNHFMTGRPVTEENRTQKFISKYLDGPNEPLYPFGYGLSYTTFTYSEIRLDKVHLSGSDAINLTLSITNTGTVPGEEIVQLYIQDLYGSSVRPVKELKGFRKVRLNAEESKEVRFTITEADLKYYLADGSYKAEPGEFKVYVGPNSRDVQESKFELVK